MSGKYESRHKINDFDTDFIKQALAKTYPALLKKAGYEIGLVGKFGIGSKNISDTLFNYCAAERSGQPVYELKNSSGKIVHYTDSVGKDIHRF
ncbi:hypothetical protein [Dyadobacter sp. 3J3]|uniref:hypothetical protein n=1 Tax=Dyadobacter sp. 3J3 TaxID=2606600 RepID=UPI001E3A25D2